MPFTDGQLIPQPIYRDVVLEVNGVAGNQQLLNLKDTTSISVHDDGAGNITMVGVDLQINGVDNGKQNKLNLKSGPTVTLTDDGLGGVTIAASGVLLKTNGVNNPTQTTLNLIAGSNVTLSPSGTGDVTIAANFLTHAEPLTDGAGNFIFDVGDIICVVGVPN